MRSKHIHLFALLSIPIVLSAHDIRMGVYELSGSDGDFKLEMRLDLEDIVAVVRELNPHLANSDRRQFEACLIEYIELNFCMSINLEKTELNFLKFEYGADVISVLATIETVQKQVKIIDLYNTMLIDAIDKHSNVIRLKLNAKERSFRMDKDRLKVTAEY